MEVALAVREAGLEDARVGIVGASYLPLAAWRVIRQELPHMRVEFADDILFRRRMRKSAAEIELMKAASRTACEIQNAMLTIAAEGRTDADLARAGHVVCLDSGAVPWDFAFASGPESFHGYWCRLPPWDRNRRYEIGDLVHPDVYGCLDGYFFDLQRTLSVGGAPSARQLFLLEGVVGVVQALCAAARPGKRAGDLAHLRHEWLAEYGYISAHDSGGDESLDELVACGHGLGLGFELPWIAPSSDDVLEPGMTIAFEVYLTDPSVGTVALEEVVLVTDDEPEILTRGCQTRWW
jgi:Xaa-Pro aminopeptidase